jgi:hypothetical protein
LQKRKVFCPLKKKSSRYSTSANTEHPWRRVSFHINKATPDFDAGRSDHNAVSFDVSRPAGTKPDLIARQYIKKLVEAIRNVPATTP